MAPQLAPASTQPQSAGAPQRPRVFLHVGLHKTGTTSVQSYLARNRARLAAEGLLVPTTGVPVGFDGHHLLPWSLIGRNPERLAGLDRDRLWADLRSELEHAACPRAILSSEEFVHLDNDAVARLGDLLDGCEIIPIVILRRPGDVLEGWYRTHVFSGGSQSMQRYVGDHWQRYCDYLSLLRRWRDLAGGGSMIIGSYDDPAIGRDVVRVLLGWLGHTVAAETANSDSRLNSGLPAALIELARWLRQSKVSQAQVAEWLDAMGRLPFTRTQLASPRFLPAAFDAALDAEYCRQLDRIEADPLLAPQLLSQLPRPQARRARTLAGPAEALLELPSLISGKPAPEHAGTWLPRRLRPDLGPDLDLQCRGNLDAPAAPGELLALQTTRETMFAGWAFHEPCPDAEWHLSLRPMDGTAASELLAPLSSGTARPDVARAYPATPPQIAARSGFRASLELAAVPRGRYELRIVAATDAGLVPAAWRRTVQVGCP